MHKRGETGSQIMFVVFLSLLLVVGAGIVFGVYMFYGGEYEFRNEEAGALLVHIENCLMEKGIPLQSEFIKTCGLNENYVIGSKEEIMIKLCEIKAGEDCFEDYTAGTIVFGSNFPACKFAGRGESYPRCKSSEIALGNVEYELIVGNNKHARRILA